MAHIPFIDELVVIVALSVVVTLLVGRLRMPAVAGLLLAGALAGPSGFGLVQSMETVESIAEIGVVLLLFTIGLELPLERLRPILRQIVVGGALQVGLTIAATVAVAAAFGEPVRRGVFWGFLLALSSTAIVLRALTERREVEAPHGRFIVGVLLFQDLAVVPMMLVVPILAVGGAVGGGVDAGVDGAAADTVGALGRAIFEALLVVAAVVVAARAVVPWLLRHVDANRSREVFLLAVLALCIGTAWLTAHLGLSLALGAFLGGVIVADTRYAHRALGDMIPLRDAFVSVFFASMGMLFDPAVLVEAPVATGAFFAAFVLGKGVLATLAALAMRFPPRAAWLAGAGLAQFGELGFVLARVGAKQGVVDEVTLRPALAAGILSMFVTPLLVRAAPHIRAGERLLAPLARLLGARSIAEATVETHHLAGHVVIVGYGLGGRQLARALNASGIPHVVLELNEATVRAARKAGEPVFYADATSTEALAHAHVERARAVVLLVNDGLAAERIVTAVRDRAPGVPVLLRARWLADRDRLLRLGADDVVAEEVEGGLEVLARVLRRLEVPRNVIDGLVRDARSATAPSERTLTVPRRTLPELGGLGDLKIECVLLTPGSRAVGGTLDSLAVRSATGALVVAVRRGGRLLDAPDPTAPLLEGDVVYVAGTIEAIGAAVELLDGPGGAGVAS